MGCSNPEVISNEGKYWFKKDRVFFDGRSKNDRFKDYNFFASDGWLFNAARVNCRYQMIEDKIFFTECRDSKGNSEKDVSLTSREPKLRE